ncbi:MAG: P22 phage major capsid protein family protein, partial [Candidatus Neomarinimicrobiota bacterium]
MANTTLTASVIAKEAILQLHNHLVMGKQVFRGYEEEFNKSINGYERGNSISVKRPMDFEVRDGAVMNVQETTEGKFLLSVDKRKGIDFEFTSQELTLNIKELSERVIKPAMIQLANQVDTDLQGLYKDVAKWVGTPGQTINSNTDFSKGPESLDLAAAPQDNRCSTLSPSDHWGLVGAQTSLLNDRLVGEAYKKGSLGMIGGVDTFMTQNVP